MKIQIVILFLLYYLFNNAINIFASEKNNLPASNSFINDIVVHYDPDHANGNCDIAVAFNGWIYVAHSFEETGPPGTSIKVSISKDSGATWQPFTTVLNGSHNGAQVYDIAVTGNDTSSMRVYVAYYNFSVAFPYSLGGVAVVDGLTGSPLPQSISLGDGTYNINNVRLATDVTNPAFGTVGNSVAILYSTGSGDSTNTDSLVCLISDDTASTTYIYYLVDSATTTSIQNPSIDYGYSQAWNNGRYFIAYEKGDHIAYCRNNSTINSGFTAPLMIDMQLPVCCWNLKEPKIICQSSMVNNDSTGLSVIIITKLLDSLFTMTNRIPYALYNMQAALSDNWYGEGIFNSGSAVNLKNFDACYSESNDEFYMTGYDMDSGELFSVMEDFNFTHPDNWYVISQQYNDSVIDPSVDPLPRIATDANYIYTSWTSATLGTGGDPSSQILFDKHMLPIITTVGQTKNYFEYSVFPNPAALSLSVKVHNGNEIQSAGIYDVHGRVFYSSVNQHSDQMTISTTEIPDGLYFLKIISDKVSSVKAVMIIH